MGMQGGMMGMQGGMMGMQGGMMGMQGGQGGSTWMQSIEHVVMAFGQVSMLLQENQMSLYQFFMSGISMVDRFSRLHETVTDFASNKPADEDNLPPIFPGPNGQMCTYGPNGEMMPASAELIAQREEIIKKRPPKGPSIWWAVGFVALFAALFRWAKNKLARKTVMPAPQAMDQQQGGQQQQNGQWNQNNNYNTNSTDNSNNNNGYNNNMNNSNGYNNNMNNNGMNRGMG